MLSLLIAAVPDNVGDKTVVSWENLRRVVKI